MGFLRTPKLIVTDDELAENLRRVEELLSETRAIRARAKLGSAIVQPRLLNLVEFCAIFNGDLSSALHAFSASRSDWERRFHARVLVVVMHEAAAKLPSIIGKSLAVSIRSSDASGAFEARRRLLHKSLSQFQQTFDNEHRTIRHNALAHRNPQGENQLAAIDALDPAAIEARGWQLIGWLNDLHALISDFLIARRGAA
jgi:hypothetical protein